MCKYDSILYGNGLSIGIISEISKITNSLIKKYLEYSIFLNDFVYEGDHRRIFRDFTKYIKNYEQYKEEHDRARKYLKKNHKEIHEFGYERWISKNLPCERELITSVKEYGYLIYNYWYHVINLNVLCEPDVKNYLMQCSEKIKDRIINKKIYLQLISIYY